MHAYVLGAKPLYLDYRTTSKQDMHVSLRLHYTWIGRNSHLVLQFLG